MQPFIGYENRQQGYQINQMVKKKYHHGGRFSLNNALCQNRCGLSGGHRVKRVRTLGFLVQSPQPTVSDWLCPSRPPRPLIHPVSFLSGTRERVNTTQWAGMARCRTVVRSGDPMRSFSMTSQGIQPYVFASQYNLPHFLKTQKESFKRFLTEGLVQEFKLRQLVAETHDHWGNRPLRFQVSFFPEAYRLARPKRNLKQAILERQTYGSDLYVPICVKDSQNKTILLEWVCVATLPLMTSNGHFIINGLPRIVMSQMVRSPGVYFKKMFRSQSTNYYHTADFIAQRGTWLRLETDTKRGDIWVKMKNEPKLSFLPFLQAWGGSASLWHRYYHTGAYTEFRVPKSFAPPVPNSVSNPLALSQEGFERIRRYESINFHRFMPMHTAFLEVWKSEFFYSGFIDWTWKRFDEPFVPMTKYLSFDPYGFSRSYLASLTHQIRGEEAGRYVSTFLTPSTKQTLSMTPFASALHTELPFEGVPSLKKNFRPQIPMFDVEKSKQLETKNELLQMPMDGIRQLDEEWGLSVAQQQFESQKKETDDVNNPWEADGIVSALKKAAGGQNSDDEATSGSSSDNDEMKESSDNQTFGDELDNLDGDVLDRDHQWNDNQQNSQHASESSSWSISHSTSLSEANDEKRGDDEQVKGLNPTRVINKALKAKFLNPKRYNLSVAGRARINRTLGLNIPLTHTQLTDQDLVFAAFYLMECAEGNKQVSDIDDLSNRQMKPVGELLQAQLGMGLEQWEEIVYEQLDPLNKTITPRLVAFYLRAKQNPTQRNRAAFTRCLDRCLNFKPIQRVFKDFFNSNPLSQMLDQTNPLAEVTHKRRLSSLGIGGVSRQNASMEIRGIHPTHYGRICPIETPEGQNAGLVNSLTIHAKVTPLGFIQTPFYQTYKGWVAREKGPTFLLAEQEKMVRVGPGDLYVNQFHLLPPKILLPSRQSTNVERVGRGDLNYVAVHPLQMISIATSLIPFLEHDDGNRALMGSNMQRQAVPTLKPTVPIVGTGLEAKVISDVEHGLYAKKSGWVSYVDSQQISVHSPQHLPLPRHGRALTARSGVSQSSAKEVDVAVTQATSVVGTATEAQDMAKRYRNTLQATQSVVRRRSKSTVFQPYLYSSYPSFSSGQKTLNKSLAVSTTMYGGNQMKNVESFVTKQRGFNCLLTPSFNAIQGYSSFLNLTQLQQIFQQSRYNDYLGVSFTLSLLTKQKYYHSDHQKIQEGKFPFYLGAHRTVWPEMPIILNAVLGSLNHMVLTPQTFNRRLLSFSSQKTSFALTAQQTRSPFHRSLVSTMRVNTTKTPLHQVMTSSTQTQPSQVEGATPLSKVSSPSLLLRGSRSIERPVSFVSPFSSVHSPATVSDLLANKPSKTATPAFPALYHPSLFKAGFETSSHPFYCSSFDAVSIFASVASLTEQNNTKTVGKKQAFNLRPEPYFQPGVNFFSYGAPLSLPKQTYLPLMPVLPGPLSVGLGLSSSFKPSLTLPLANRQEKSPVSFKVKNYHLASISRSNQDTYVLQRPAVQTGQWVQQGDLLADNSCSQRGELAIGKNLFVGYTPWEGYNFEDAVLLSDRVLSEELFSSIHVERYEAYAEDTSNGMEEIRATMPDDMEDQTLPNLDLNGVIKVGTWVNEGDILVRKSTPIGDTEERLSNYEQLLYDILQKAAPKVRDSSLRVPKNVHGRVIHVEILETAEDLRRNAKEEASSFNPKGKKKKLFDLGKKAASRKTKAAERKQKTDDRKKQPALPLSSKNRKGLKAEKDQNDGLPLKTEKKKNIVLSKPASSLSRPAKKKSSKSKKQKSQTKSSPKKNNQAAFSNHTRPTNNAINHHHDLFTREAKFKNRDSDTVLSDLNNLSRKGGVSPSLCQRPAHLTARHWNPWVPSPPSFEGRSNTINKKP